MQDILVTKLCIKKMQTQITEKTLRLTKKAVRDVIGIVKLSAGNLLWKARREAACLSISGVQK